MAKKKKPAELYVYATVVSCERMQLYLILTKVVSATVVVKAGAPHSPKWWHILTVEHLGISSPLISTKATESLHW